MKWMRGCGLELGPRSRDSAEAEGSREGGQRVEAKHQGDSKWFGRTLMAVDDDGEPFKVCYDGATFNGWLPVTEPKVLV